jgi:glycosyltransferase involved in cell wall biosynthesis
VRRPIAGVAVVVPARDEAELVARCLASVREARLLLAGPASAGRAGHEEVRVVTVVVADDCSDETASIAAALPDVTVVETRLRSVGAARSEGARLALERLAALGVPGDAVWIANTDADSAVPPAWLTSQLDLADGEGADVVVGTVRPDFADLSPAQVAAWLSRHTPGRPNGHVHGANLGLRASVYAAAGGFGELDLHEDVELVARARAAGAVVVASEAGEVLTSGRQVGRTRGGYAGYLANDLLA